MTERKIMPVEQCGAVSSCMASPQSYASYIRFGEPTPKRIAAHATDALEAARKEDLARHERNTAAIENNKLVRADIEIFMSKIEMPKSFQTKNPRSIRYNRMITNEAGYIADIKRSVPIDDGFASATVTYNGLKVKYDAFAAEAARADDIAREAAEAEGQRKRIERLENIEFAKIILRYGMKDDAEWSDVLKELRGRDKRLDLALAMEDTRGDWSDGFYRVRYAIDRFKLETDQDKEILADILPLLSGDEEDGRIFRDTTWNYNALYELVEDKQLVTDARLARQKANRE
ncbi:hypothetical protein ABIF65_003791 [Bradyrhizobium japonicum]|uniref:hypothetical protein n=1 Tax=Bradyrhizobium TaxID=374 RepID=UPI0004AF42F9|nr:MULTISPECIES: hypothetical protein [Bradyrhizobium]MBR0947247.1 hypothetical protein [Bradyrhizobium liaoningense]MBR0998726.1 hypothetical protein [Bradyrhizobium liaoningense]MBR1034021.1 hypothetical protein [Bradyrhizobium liaoningense]